MASRSTRTSSQYDYDTSSYYQSASSRPRTGRRSAARPRTSASTLAGIDTQQIVCAVSESRGVSPTVGLAFLNLDTCEAVLSQICDSQTYVKTLHKLQVFGPSELLIVSTAAHSKSKLFCVLEENAENLDCDLTLLDRRYWAETSGFEYIQQLAFADDLENIKIATSGNYFAVCCFSAVLKFVENGLNKTFPFHSLRIRYESSEGCMMIDVPTIHSLELIQNLQEARSKDCLFGLLNETQTPMGSRLLRSNILQPLTAVETLNFRYDALEELSTKEEMFFGVRQALKGFVDVDKLLTSLIVIANDLRDSPAAIEQSVNKVIMLRQFVLTVGPIYEALAGCRSALLLDIRELCAPSNINPVRTFIDDVINEDVKYSRSPLDLRYQRTFAVKSGVNGLLDVARTTFRENSDDAIAYASALKEEHELTINLKFDPVRQFYLTIPQSELKDRVLPQLFMNVVKRRNLIECSTLDLVKRNQKIVDSHNECLLMSDETIQNLLGDIRGHASVLFKICEGISMLDMISGFAQLVTTQEYVRPALGDTLAIRNGRHPIKEKIQKSKFVPNDVYATKQTRFQIVTGCNMAGKSTYIRSIALMAVMAQIGSFVPAQYASFPMRHQLFARVSVDDNIEANVSTFSAEMKEAAFILHNIDKDSLAIVDELGRGTSSRDGLAIAIAIAEALVDSKALVWFATHFVELAKILAERTGVVNLHLSVDMSIPNTMKMLYKVVSGAVRTDHYGIALAKVIPLPASVIDHAVEVSDKLTELAERRQKNSKAAITHRRRRLILGLKEHLVQAQNGAMQGEALRAWLKELQKEFVARMTALEEAEQEVDSGSDVERDTSPFDGASATGSERPLSEQ